MSTLCRFLSGSKFNKKQLTLNFILRQLSSNNDHVLKSPSSEIVPPNVPVHEWVYEKIGKYHNYTAIECASSKKKYTFEQIRVKAGNLNRALRNLWKLEKGDVVAVLHSNSPDFAIACLGIMEAGLVLTTLNPNYTPGEISKQLLDASVKVIITQSDKFQDAKSACKLIKKDIPIITTKNKESDSIPNGSVSFEELINTQISLNNISFGNSEELAFLPYSSGTTGLPKGVMVSHRNIVAMNLQITHPDFNFTEPTTDQHQDVIPGVLPFFHIFGFTFSVLFGLTTGAKLVTLPQFSPNLLLSAFKMNKISIMHLVPPLILFLINHPEFKSEHLQHLKFIMCGAAPLGILEEDKLRKKIGHPFYMVQGYGLTESTSVISIVGKQKRIEDLEQYRGSVGTPVSNTQVKIMDIDKDKILGPNKEGEIWAKGPQITLGYLNRPEENEKSFEDGWFKTGDIGYHKNGIIYVTDRIKELIKVKGFQVPPAELEELVRDIPGVKDAAVIGVPHSRYGEVPRAYVVSEDPKLVSLDVQNYVAERVAEYKHLIGGVEFVEIIPKNASGKILRRELREKYKEKIKI